MRSTGAEGFGVLPTIVGAYSSVSMVSPKNALSASTCAAHFCHAE